MSQFDEVIAACKTQMTSCGIDCDEALLKAIAQRLLRRPRSARLRLIAKGLGPSIYDSDGKLVAATAPAEIETVKTNFIAGKLGVSGDAAEAAITYAIEKIGASNRQKLRPVFYYLIVKNLGKESVFV